MSKLVKKVEMFQDESGRPHNSILDCLQSNKFLAIRGIVQEENKNETLTIGDVVKLMQKQGKKIVQTMSKYDKAMNKARTKANPLPAA
jgi:hypothetical protein